MTDFNEDEEEQYHENQNQTKVDEFSQNFNKN